MKSFRFALLSPPLDLEPTRKALRMWMQDVKGVDEQHIALMQAFLDERYLRSIPLSMGAFFVIGFNAYKQWFWVFTTWVLGWTCRKDEGKPSGFP